MPVSSKEFKIAAVPAGEWVSTLGKVAADNGFNVTLYIRNPESLERFKRTRVVDRLSGIKMPKNVSASSDLEAVLDGADDVIFGPSSPSYRELTEQVVPFLGSKTKLLSVTKGLELGTDLRISQVLFEVAPSLEYRSAFLSGPTLAREVARRRQTGAVIASNEFDISTAKHFRQILNNSRFKIYPNPDLIGVELGGALKNPYSIGAGIEAGLAGRFGIAGNTHSLLYTRSLAEMIIIGEALGADPITFAGLSGAGDLLLGFSGKTRNFKVGQEIARGKSVDEIRASGILSEGLNTLPAILDLVERKRIDAPIIRALNGVCFEDLRIQDALRQFMDADTNDEYVGMRGPRFYLGRAGAWVKQGLSFINR